MPLQLDKLRMSLRQKYATNTDATLANWPQIFFWTDGLILLNWTEGLLKRLSELDHEIQENFWKGSVTAQIRNLDPELFEKWPLTRIGEYCQIWKSKKRAWTRLIIKARGEREQRKRDSEVSFGEIRLDEQHWMLREAALHKAVNIYALPHIIHKAAEQNDVRFFIRLGRALQSTKRPVEIDWKRVDPIAVFLVNNWCEGQDYKSRLPALCFFSDQALADFCSAAFGKKPGNPSAEAVRQWRKRLGLKQARSPKVKETIVIGSEILLTDGK